MTASRTGAQNSAQSQANLIKRSQHSDRTLFRRLGPSTGLCRAQPCAVGEKNVSTRFQTSAGGSLESAFWCLHAIAPCSTVHHTFRNPGSTEPSSANLSRSRRWAELALASTSTSSDTVSARLHCGGSPVMKTRGTPRAHSEQLFLLKCLVGHQPRRTTSEKSRAAANAPSRL